LPVPALTLDGAEYKLVANNSTNHLHGVFGKSVWQARPLPATKHTAALELNLPQQSRGGRLPGQSERQGGYTLTDAHELRLDFTRPPIRPRRSI